MNIDELLKEIIVSESKSQKGEDFADKIEEIVKALTLEELVAKEAPKETKEEVAPAFGDQAESYTLTIPSYENTTTSYAVDYTAQAVEMNDKTTQATYTAEISDAKLYEAAWAVLDASREANNTGQRKSDYSQSLDERERAHDFKSLYPSLWMAMYGNHMLKTVFF